MALRGLRRLSITVGVDFAAAPKNTAACVLEWHDDHVVVLAAHTVVDDAALLDLLRELPADGRLGIDCPLGWPVDFVTAVQAHRDRAPWPGRGRADRTDLLWRATDRWIRERCGRWPLSVSTDRIGVTALRAAFVLDAWGPVDRSGMTGPVVEVYPAVARRLWHLGATRSVEEVAARLPVRFPDPAARDACDASEHAFDALIAGLVARAAALGRTAPPPDDLRDAAEAEGWIHVPDDAPLESLVDASPQALCLRFNDAITARSHEGLAELMTADHAFIDSGGEVVRGRDACLAAWDGFFEAFPDYRNEFDVVQSSGGPIVIRGRSVCRTPELDGPALWSARVEGSLVAEWRVHLDTPDNRRDLGFDD